MAKKRFIMVGFFRCVSSFLSIEDFQLKEEADIAHLFPFDNFYSATFENNPKTPIQ